MAASDLSRPNLMQPIDIKRPDSDITILKYKTREIRESKFDLLIFAAIILDVLVHKCCWEAGD